MESNQRADGVIDEIAGRQHGLVTRTQLLGAGVSADVVRWRVQVRRLVPVHRGVYRVGPVVAPRAREMAAVLACGSGALVSHRSAGVLRRLCNERSAAVPVDVTVPNGDRGSRPGIRAHRVPILGSDEVTEIEGIPVTSLARTIFDLASQAASGEMARVFAVAVREHGMNSAELSELIRRYPKRPGIPVLRALLAEDTPPALTRSEAERRLLHLISKAQLPRPEANVWTDGFEIDFLWRTQRVVVEVDGFAFHGSRSAFESDRRRDATLAALGFRVMRLTWRQLEREPEVVLVRLAQALLATEPAASHANGARRG